MAKHHTVVWYVSFVLLLDILLFGAMCFPATGFAAGLSHVLPGMFGPGLGRQMTGNHLFGALVLLLDALLFLAGGFGGLVAASRRAILIGSNGLTRLLSGTAGLSREDIAATEFAVAEEQKLEIHKLESGRNLVWIGALLLLLAFPAVCFTYAQADVKGEPLLQAAGGAVSNAAVTVPDVAVFALDQLADAVLLDIPRVFQWNLTSLSPGHHHMWLRPFVLLYHILSKLVVLATFFAAWRSGHLRGYVMQMAGLDALPALASLRETAPPSPLFAPANDHRTPPEIREPEHFADEPPETVLPEAPVEPVPDPVAEYAREPQEDIAPGPEPVFVEEAAALPPEMEAVEVPTSPGLAMEQAVEYAEEEPVQPEESILATPVYVAARPDAEHVTEPMVQPPLPEETAPELPFEAGEPEHLAQEEAPAAFIEPEPMPLHSEPGGSEDHHAEAVTMATEKVPPTEPGFEPVHDDIDHENPAPLEASLLEVPGEAAPEHPAELSLSDAPLALHELKSPDEIETPAADNHEARGDMPYKNTALHLTSEFDA